MKFRLALIAALAATPALAQPRPDLQIFISPAGEPFRAPLDQPYPVEQWFKQADANADGAITRDELVADSLAFFDKLDANKDGAIDGWENGDYEKKVAPEIMSRAAMALARPREGNRPKGGRYRPTLSPYDRARPDEPGKMVADQNRVGAGLYGLVNEVQPVMGQDSDFNRRISRAEATAAAKDRFAILDKDKDGKLVLATLPETPLQRALADAR
ncbi:hypothetical protein [Caulobacter sp. NIBR1757]|uniref:hypothetical protein n=1 Tax=Caulobacter sp. NIBR1757 TaxID=3016000 RepID=UPI0022F0DAAB|nr:hypothetical protein [Caulobacter sp. NIBR1757]WGM39665.1 hypothetical protein AMEJIAPC_02590 [Caulobacter sp. NIBR1757]